MEPFFNWPAMPFPILRNYFGWMIVKTQLETVWSRLAHEHTGYIMKRYRRCEYPTSTARVAPVVLRRMWNSRVLPGWLWPPLRDVPPRNSIMGFSLNRLTRWAGSWPWVTRTYRHKRNKGSPQVFPQVFPPWILYINGGWDVTSPTHSSIKSSLDALNSV